MFYSLGMNEKAILEALEEMRLGQEKLMQAIVGGSLSALGSGNSDESSENKAKPETKEKINPLYGKQPASVIKPEPIEPSSKSVPAGWEALPVVESLFKTFDFRKTYAYMRASAREDEVNKSLAELSEQGWEIKEHTIIDDKDNISYSFVLKRKIKPKRS